MGRKPLSDLYIMNIFLPHVACLLMSLKMYYLQEKGCVGVCVFSKRQFFRVV